MKVRVGILMYLLLTSMMIQADDTIPIPVSQTFQPVSQTGDPAFEAQVDSLKKVYLDMGVDDETAERRARGAISQQQGISMRTGNPNGLPNPGSIHVNRNTTYQAYTAQQLVDSIFVKGGACSAVSNVKLQSHGWNDTTNTWRSNSDFNNRGLGYFSRGTSNFEMEEGLVLTTSYIISIEGPNQADNGINISPGMVGDADLDSLLNPTSQITYHVENATVLEFDFVPVSSVMQFRYVFASDEYSNYVNTTYNDIFGFLISGPGITGKQNIAILPSTNTLQNIVSINNVNMGHGNITNHNCPTQFTGAISNPSYYINIPGSFSSACGWPLTANSRNDSLYKSMEFNGRTVVLTATYNVVPCQTYHLKLAVGNAGDKQWQSGVFLEARSFDIGERIINWGSMNEEQDFVYRSCLENKFEVIRTNGNSSVSDTVLLNYSGSAYALGDISPVVGISLPDTVIIPVGIDTVSVSYMVNAANIGAGHKEFIITSLCPCGGGSFTKIIDVYDPSDPDDFQVVATPSCPSPSNGTIIFTPGSGGSGVYETSIDGGATWQLSTTLGHTYTGLAAGNYTVLIRDNGGCRSVNISVSTIMKPVLSGSPDLCPPTYSTALTVSGQGAVSYQWYKVGTGLISGATSATYNATTTGAYYATVYNGTCNSQPSDTITVTSGNCLYAFDDYSQTLRETPDTIPVLINDSLATCPSLIPVIIAPLSTDGSATVNGNRIVFIPNPGFIGVAEVHYKITCGAKADSAVIHINVIDYPDNVITAGCFLYPPGSPWSFKESVSSASIVADQVHACATPVAGDIDGDGLVEIIVPSAMNDYFYTPNGLRIYKVSKQMELTLMQTLSVGNLYVSGQVSIASVDGNKNAALFVVTNVLSCYKLNNTGLYNPSPAWTASIPLANFLQPMIADFDGDGRAEVLVGNRIYDAATGTLVASGTYTDFGLGGHGISGSAGQISMISVADFDNDGLPEIAIANNVYKVNTSAGTITLWKTCEVRGDVGSGLSAVADIDLDGYLDVIVMRRVIGSVTANLYVWNPMKGKLLHTNTVSVNATTSYQWGPSLTFVGDLDNDGYPEIAFHTLVSGGGRIYTYRYDPGSQQLVMFWPSPVNTTDFSGATTMTLFDFDQNGENELVYRDMDSLRILRGTDGQDVIKPILCGSGTVNEYPIVIDADGDGSADIVVTGKAGTTNAQLGDLHIYSSNIPGSWAPARKVWNQHMYNAVNINEDLTVPRYQLNPATRFPGPSNTYDVRPYNGFLMQQTMIDTMGLAIWLVPDIKPDSTSCSVALVGDSLVFTLVMINQGEKAIGAPVHFSLYKETVSPGTFIKNDSLNIQIHADSTVTITYKIAVDSVQPAYKLFVRLNDKGNGSTFPFQPECDDTNNVIDFINPALYRLMTKKAEILSPPIAGNGTYPNPVATLYTETIEYTISAVNASLSAGTVTITDTIPIYLEYVSSNPSVIPSRYSTNPDRYRLEWILPAVPSFDTARVTFRVEPESGVSASQPMFINRAWVKIGTINDTIIPTNYTYHQGAGISIVTFSAGFGGNIYNASQQALDYRTSPRTGIVIAPDEGYRFAGWSHADYLSLRGETIGAQSGITHYDTLTIYGDVELHADFDLEIYGIEYHLYGSINAKSNPLTYTINSGDITLETPEKADDVFVGWTGSNGDVPQQTVTIPAGSTGARTYYANFLNSVGNIYIEPDMEPEDKVWAAGNELYVKTTKQGSIVRIYSLDGVLQRQQVLLRAGETAIKLPSGLYVVTLNNGIAKKINIE